MPKPYEFEDPSYVITSVVKQFTIVYDLRIKLEIHKVKRLHSDHANP